MNVLFVAAECYPFVKIGGLGDVVSSLPKELNALGIDARVIIPKYKVIDESLLEDADYIDDLNVFLGTKHNKVGLLSKIYQGVKYYFLENDKYFNRDNVYDYEDEHERWALFQLATLEAIKHMSDFKVDIINCHDWHTAMIPQLIKSKYYRELGNVKTVFTIHNIMYQGVFDRQLVKVFNIPFDQVMELNGKMNFMKSAILSSDYVTTVSESYRDELLSSEFFSMGLGQFLQQKAKKNEFIGILNGIDYTHFSPENDEYLPLKYDYSNYKEGKLEAKKKLYDILGVDFYTNVPMIGMVTRLTKPKGLDLIIRVIDELMEEYTFKFIILGTGEKQYEDFFKDLENRHPYKVKFYNGYSDEIASLIYGASDMFLMPSAFEPCGLGQMISLKYGSLPIVREIGGLKDTIEPYNEYELTGNGFSFTNYNAHDMLYVIKYAFRTYSQENCWNILVQNAMSEDFSFKSSAKKYQKFYNRVLNIE